jgi:hypothetical protein
MAPRGPGEERDQVRAGPLPVNPSNCGSVAMRDLAAYMREFFQHCAFVIKMRRPIYLVSIAANDAVFVVRFNEDEDSDDFVTTPICEHTPDAGFMLPIVVTAIDLDGNGSSARITQAGLTLN